MKKLQEIVRLVARKRLRKIEIFNDSGHRSGSDNLYYKFYHGIRDGRFVTDEDAAKGLFGTVPSDKKYLMLKSRVKTRLMNTLFFLENSTSRYQQALYSANRDLFSARVLLLNGARETAASMLKSTLAEAEKFSITDIAMECARHLRLHSSMMGDAAEFRHYNEKFHELKVMVEAEYYAEESVQEIIVHFAKSSSQKPELASVAREKLAVLDQMIGTQPQTHSLKLNTLRLRLVMHQIEGNHRATLGVAQEGENYLLRRPHLIQPARLGEFALNQMVACMHLGDYAQGEENARRCFGYFTEGSNNWMIFLEYFFLLCMQTGNFQRAAGIYETVVSNPRFSNLDEARTEKWRIFNGFLCYMMAEQEPDQTHEQRRFNLMKFLNEVPIYSRDKRGLNISILILQILFLLDRKDWNGIISRTEALKIYASRHLKRDDTFRSSCFVKMMLTMEKKDFDRHETERIAAKYLVKLRSSRFDYQGDLGNLEVIPYEMLWENVLSRLKLAA